MATSFAQKVDIFFDEAVLGFDAMNVSAMNVAKYKADGQSLSRSSQTFWRPMPFLREVVDGRDISSANGDVTELVVPATLTDAMIRNTKMGFTGIDLNNEDSIKKAALGSARQLSNKVDTLVADAIATKGTLAVINSGNIDTYDDAAEADALMLEQQCTSGDRCMLLNPRMAKNILGNLAGRGTMTGAPISAYTSSELQPIGGFNTYRTDYGKTITGNAGTGDLIAGASQNYTPVSNSGGLPVDNRQMDITIDDGAAGNPSLAVGDAFTIAGVNAVGHVNKQDTGQLKTFRVLAVSGTTVTISPAIIPADGSAQSQKDYANVTTTPADNAAVTILNTTTKMSSVFYEKDAIEIVHADFDVSAFEADGKKIRRATTDSGIQIVLMNDSNVDTLAATYRMFIWCNAEVLNPEHAGIMLEGQV